MLLYTVQLCLRLVNLQIPFRSFAEHHECVEELTLDVFVGNFSACRFAVVRIPSTGLIVSRLQLDTIWPPQYREAKRASERSPTIFGAFSCQPQRLKRHLLRCQNPLKAQPLRQAAEQVIAREEREICGWMKTFQKYLFRGMNNDEHTVVPTFFDVHRDH